MVGIYNGSGDFNEGLTRNVTVNEQKFGKSRVVGFVRKNTTFKFLYIVYIYISRKTINFEGHKGYRKSLIF